jgi:hypothetical protein
MTLSTSRERGSLALFILRLSLANNSDKDKKQLSLAYFFFDA